MYWVYLVIFIIAVLIPELIRVPVSVLSEEDVESLLILIMGAIGFAVYLSKEKQLFRVVAEKLNLQKVTNAIGKDLTDTYSYIGAMNRKYDIIRAMVAELPSRVREKNEKWEEILLESALLLAKTEAIGLFFVERKERKVLANHFRGNTSLCRGFTFVDARYLMEANRTFFEQDECFVVRSPRFSSNIGAFLVFPKRVNFFEDADMMKLLAAEALLLYCLSTEVKKSTARP
jgi:hypothetical protein